jgi:hypothetical protein
MRGNLHKLDNLMRRKMNRNWTNDTDLDCGLGLGGFTL